MFPSLPLNPLRELTMIRMMDNITDKPDWDKKVSIQTPALVLCTISRAFL